MKAWFAIGYLLVFAGVFFLSAHLIGQQANRLGHDDAAGCTQREATETAPVNPLIFPPLQVQPEPWLVPMADDGPAACYEAIAAETGQAGGTVRQR